MKKVIAFQTTNSGYGFYENGEEIFEISKADLQFDVKKFYVAFFANDNDYSDIELKNCLETDKVATRVFSCTEQLIKEIVSRLKKELDEGLNKDNLLDAPV